MNPNPSLKDADPGVNPSPLEAMLFSLGTAVQHPPPEYTPRDIACGHSLLRRWAERGLTPRQERMCGALAHKANRSAPASSRPVQSGPMPYRGGAPWWADTSSEAQRRRGLKSGLVRRWQRRDRDQRIVYHVRRGVRAVSEIAAHFKLHATTVRRIVSRATGGPGFFREESEARNLPHRVVVREPSGEHGIVPAARPVDPSLPSNVGVFRALAAWCGLRMVKRLPDSAVAAEAERLNGTLAVPLGRAEMGRTVRSLNKLRARWV